MGNLIEIPLHKGCILMLTPDEYKKGITRGKAIRRARQFEARQGVRDGSLDRQSNIQPDAKGQTD